MNGILYFSGTGNSLYIAKKIQEKIKGQILYIPNYQKTGEEFDKIILVTPIYSFGMPKHVYEFLPRLDKNKELIVIQNYGGMIAGADYLMLQYCLKNKLNIKSIFTLKMPENFTLTFTVPQFYLKSVLKKVDKRLEKIINDIQLKNYQLPKKKKTREKTYFKNMSNWYKIGEEFKVNDQCNQCQKCVQICPVKNIAFENDKIVFSNKCVACLGCYHRCPKKAIQYKNHKKKDRYINPNIHENEIGKDIK